ncbi:type II toxin-antitoxin system toxin DNA ADP-ribosyl transferase DarT [Streptomyces antimycoticus]|uniref:type II toxin-antitoxin system toxin DNA ADP-ribosyl transferase DarT n=1 Tax=Streptomyces antimycoticus TaxID=68175 RepID=UPI00137502CB|nr:DUF4433 domain-containing protein [Streptomyces antimycoticus]
MFHFTHVRNLRDVLASKQLVSDSIMQSRGGVPVECGDRGIKAGRRTRPVKVPPHGVPADYVPFYFAPRSPMLYKIYRGGVPTYQDGQLPLVYLVTTVKGAVSSGRPYVFSDGNCAAEITRHFTDLDRMADVVDWELLQAQHWANTSTDGDRMRRRMAEFLIHQTMPISALHTICTYDRQHADRVQRLLKEANLSLPVTVRRDWYY